MLRVEPVDFHQATPGGVRMDQIVIRLTFRGLTRADRGAFAEFLTYEMVEGKVETILIVSWWRSATPTKAARAVLTLNGAPARRATGRFSTSARARSLPPPICDRFATPSGQ